MVKENMGVMVTMRNGVARFGERPRVTKKEKEQIRILYNNEGLSAVQVSQKLNIPPATIFYHIRRMGISRSRATAQRTRHSTDYTSEQLEEIRHLYIAEHLSSTQIAAKLSISSRSVARIIKKLGIARESTLAVRLRYGEKQQVVAPPPQLTSLLLPALARQRDKLINDYHTRVHSIWQEYQERCNKPMSNAGRCNAHQDFLAQIKPDLENLFWDIAQLNKK